MSRFSTKAHLKLRLQSLSHNHNINFQMKHGGIMGPISNNRSNQIDTSNVERKKHILINYM